MHKLLMIIAVVFVIAGCSGGTNKANKQIFPNNTNTSSKTEVTEGDFVYRLVSEKSVYTEGEKVEIYAELEYVGDEPGIKIAHAASPFSFPMKEKIRNFEVGYFMPLPGLVTELKKGVPLRKRYEGGGGYGSQDPKDYVDFIKAVSEASQKGTLPWGDYEFSGTADFEPIYGSVENNKNENLQLKAQIEFIVEKPKNIE